MICMRDKQGCTADTLAIFIVKTVRKDLQLDNSAKGTHCCVSMETMNTFLLLKATSTPTAIQSEHTVTFPWQQMLGGRATVPRCMYRYASLNNGDTF
jgi:hypothetical protein